ncbi:MAG: phosphotransferase [Defluviitaleaceae bacterium]|nr:phosphotransferase [Defluviitaleaceae bacterium]
MQKTEKNFTHEDKIIFGRRLRKITDALNTYCDGFDPIDIIANAIKSKSWKKYPKNFQKERLEYLKGLRVNKNDCVYCHGDINPSNILVGKRMELYLIDFADAVLAPPEYEQTVVASQVLCFEEPYMTGYFGKYTSETIADMCLKWLPVFDNGAATIAANIGSAKIITSLNMMRDKIYLLIEKERNRC